MGESSMNEAGDKESRCCEPKISKNFFFTRKQRINAEDPLS